jgi:hypothetical protein
VRREQQGVDDVMAGLRFQVAGQPVPPLCRSGRTQFPLR